MSRRRAAENRRHWDNVLDPQNLRTGCEGAALRDELDHWDTTEQRWAVRRMMPLPGRCVLELGGGLGVGALALARRGARVVLLDLSPRRAAAAQKALNNAGVGDRVRVVVGAAENLPFRDKTFHRLTTKSVFIHTDLPRAAREAHRVLRPAGRAVVLEPLDAHPAILLYRLLLAPKTWKAITRYWTRRRVETFLEPFLEVSDAAGSATASSVGGAGQASRPLRPTPTSAPAPRIRFFQFFGVFSAFFTYGRYRNRTLRRLCECLLDPLDAWLARNFPVWRWRFWFVGVEAARRPETPSRRR